MRRLSAVFVFLVAACSSQPEPVGFRAGFGRADITPPVPEPWTDANGDGVFSAAEGDTYEDLNDNGAFDALWLAGSFEGRAAASVSDSLSATAMVVDDGQRRIAMVSIDNFGMILDDVEDVRSRIPEEWGVDRTLVIATGTHSAPDLVGWWTPMDAALDARWAYLEQAKQGIIDAIGRAVEALEPARMQLAEIDDSKWSPVVDLRPPFVYDPGIRLMRFVDAEGEGIGTVVSWTCTPEMMGARNTAVSTDFVGALRAGLERGVGDRQGLGGMSLFLNGAYGGRLTVPADSAVIDPVTRMAVTGTGAAKSAAVGQFVIAHLDSLLRRNDLGVDRPLGVRVFSSELRIPLDNLEYKHRIRAGAIQRALSSDSLVTTELSLLVLGDIWIMTLPGEVYPEHINGGIVSTPYSDFRGSAERPALRPLLRGRTNLISGNGNDAIGPLIPYIEWDTDDPFIQGTGKVRKEEDRAVSPLAVNLTQRGFISVMRSTMQYIRQQGLADSLRAPGGSRSTGSE